jgi:cyclopropane fatty-acyl-phospholipid synthase-like methyltransferase
MQRTPEPELMDDAEQALAYASADFGEPNQLFIDSFAELFPGFAGRQVIDLGCGPGDITIAFARRYPACRVVGVDGAPAMLAHARQRLDSSGLSERVGFVQLLIDATSMARQRGLAPADAIISNSLLHHMAQADTLWQCIKALAGSHCKVLLMDLRRPASPADARRIVQQYSADEAEILKHDFYNSLLAAYTADEISTQLTANGLDSLQVSLPSDRHVLVYGEM